MKKWFPKSADHGDIKQFIVNLGLSSEHEALLIKDNGQVIIEELESNVCKLLVEKINGQKFKEQKTIYCQPIVLSTPVKQAEPSGSAPAGPAGPAALAAPAVPAALAAPAAPAGPAALAAPAGPAALAAPAVPAAPAGPAALAAPAVPAAPVTPATPVTPAQPNLTNPAGQETSSKAKKQLKTSLNGLPVLPSLRPKLTEVVSFRPGH
jgi:hypothetical protein